MHDTAFERQAILTVLLRAAQTYLIAAAHAADARVAAMLEEAASRRSDLAGAIVELAGIAMEQDGAIDVGFEDPARTAVSGLGPTRRMIVRVETQLEEVLEDLSDDTLTDQETSAARDLLSNMRAQLDTLMLSAAMTNTAPSPRAAEEKYIYRVGFATTRKSALQGGTIVDFTGERGEDLHYGFCDVTIPESHRIGSTGSPWWRRILSGDDRLRYDKPEVVGSQALWNWMRERIEGTGVHDALVFIHGYNVSFRNAALQAAQIGADLGFEGAMSFFSWPSRGRMLGYLMDGTTIQASEAAIAQYLVDVAEQSGAERVHIIAHSMGNRGLLGAMTRIVQQAGAETGRRFDQIILAAPDVDAQTFRQLAQAYRTLARRTTLYVSPADLAVRASRLINGADRIGFTPPVPAIPDIDTISVENVDMTLLGHGYVGGSDEVLADMHELLKDGTSPDQRYRLAAAMTADQQPYWTFKQ